MRRRGDWAIGALALTVLVLQAGALTDELTGTNVNEEEITLACSR